MEFFSLGSYCHIENRDELLKNIESANRLGAPIIRIWAGGKTPTDCDDNYFTEIVENVRYMAELAIKYNIKLGFEFQTPVLSKIYPICAGIIQQPDD